MRTLTILLSAALLATQPSPSVKDVMRRAEQYVAAYGEKASIVVCTERYDQQATRPSDNRYDARTLISDFAIVRAGAIRGWLGFRDVLQVDGRAVADRQDRLAQVLMASEGRFDEAQRLSDESARYNIGSIERNFNVPTAALFFFVPDNHERFKFSRRRIVEDGVWEIGFSERSRPTLIRTPDGASIPSSGALLVQPQTGIVTQTTLNLDSKADRGTGHIDVTYAWIEPLDMWLPATMDESFEVVSRTGVSSRVTGHAAYSNYRVFTTSVRIK